MSSKLDSSVQTNKSELNEITKFDTLTASKEVSVLLEQDENDLLLDNIGLEKISITWENIVVKLNHSNSKLHNLRVKFDKNYILEKKIIKNISGIAKPGEVLAILGSSGSGKTTLLNVLNFRNTGSLQSSGDIKINGKTITRFEKMAPLSGYVQQDDLFIGSLKVKEHLIFQAMLRMDKSVSKEDKMKRVEKLLKDFNLAKCEDTKIGNPERNIKGISGGERRRLSFASEVVNNPGILFCDEPTSGLDSYMAMSIVESMKNLAKNGKTIICTIHQPSSEIFEMFDQFCLISEGRLAYIGNRLKACKFFENQGYKCPENYNPADHYIRTLSVSPHEKETSLQRVQAICDAFSQSEYYSDLEKEINYHNEAQKESLASNNSTNSSLFKTNMFTQFKWLLWRNSLDLIRDPLVCWIYFIQTLLLAVVSGFIFFRIELNQEGIQNMNGVLFICVINTTFGTIFHVIGTFPREIPLFKRENQNGMYKVFSYFLSKLIIEFPNMLLVPFFFTLIFYWMTNLNNDLIRFMICSGIVIGVAQISAAYSQFISVITPSKASPTTLAGPLTVPLLIFSSFFLNNKTVPKYFFLLKYLSWFNYASDALIINQWSGVENIKCDKELSLCFTSGDDVINYFNINTDDFDYNIYMLILIVIGWRILTYILLLIKSYKR